MRNMALWRESKCMMAERERERERENSNITECSSSTVHIDCKSSSSWLSHELRDCAHWLQEQQQLALAWTAGLCTLTARAAAQGKDLPAALTHLLQQQSAHNSMLSSFPFVAFPLISFPFFSFVCVWLWMWPHSCLPPSSSPWEASGLSKPLPVFMNEQEWGK
jgi:hypothetical protein